MKHKLNTLLRAIMVACFSSASISSFASCEEAIDANAREFTPDSCSVERCCNINACGSLNMPVFIVDGVEVQLQDLDSIPQDDIERVEVIKDENITKIFSPRLGGLLLITTKSKRFLTPYWRIIIMVLKMPGKTASLGSFLSEATQSNVPRLCARTRIFKQVSREENLHYMNL